MAMDLKEIEKYIKEAMPDAIVEIQDLAGDGNHYSATVTSLKFLAAALMRDIPPMSIFSIISSSLAPEATVFSNGYKSTTTKSISGILYPLNCNLSS